MANLQRSYIFLNIWRIYLHFQLLLQKLLQLFCHMLQRLVFLPHLFGSTCPAASPTTINPDEKVLSIGPEPILSSTGVASNFSMNFSKIIIRRFLCVPDTETYIATPLPLGKIHKYPPGATTSLMYLQIVRIYINTNISYWAQEAIYSI
jgi:hypothetical protein